MKVTGCTVHFVDEGVDSGPIIAQRAVEIRPSDTVATLSDRIHVAEHELFVNVLRDIADGRLAPSNTAQRPRG